MPTHANSNLDADPSGIASLLPRTGPTVSPLSPATQTDILGILQREQDHAMSLLSLSPLLSSLFISYANRAAALESASTTPSSDSEEWKVLEATIVTMREENEKLKSKNIEVAGKLEAAAASWEAFHSQVSSLKEVNAAQQDDIRSLRSELVEVKEKYDQFVAGSNAERTTLQIQVSDLETQRAELKEAIVEQQIKISKLERQGFNSLPRTVTPFSTADTRELDNPKGRGAAYLPTRITKTEECAEQEIGEAIRKTAREEMDEVARRRVEREAAEKVKQEATEEVEREIEAEKGTMKQAEQEKERLEREEEKVEMKAKEKAGCESKEREEEKAPESDSAWSSIVGKNDCLGTSGLSQEEQANGWARARDFSPIEKKEGTSGLASIISPVSEGPPDGARNLSSAGQKDSLGGAEELELPAPPAPLRRRCAKCKKRGKCKHYKKSMVSLSNLPEVAASTEPTDAGKLDILEDLNSNVSARVSISPRSENEHRSDAVQGPPPAEPTSPALAPELGPETPLSTISKLLNVPKEAEDEVPAALEPWPSHSLTPAHQPQVPVPSPVPAKAEVERPLSLWERKKLKPMTPPVPAPSLFGGGDGRNSSGAWGNTSGGGGNAEGISRAGFPWF